MENKLEQLLNSLIERGWFPRGEDKIHSCKFDKRENKFMANYTRNGCFKVLYRSLTELCSKSRGLWQFVCENGMVNQYKMDWIKNLEIWSDKMEVELNYGSSDYEAWIIESSLKDESELEDFLLNSIKID